MYDSYNYDIYKELENKYREKKQRFYYLGNGLKLGSLFYFIILVVMLVGKLSLSIGRIKVEIIFLTIYWCALTGTRLTSLKFDITPGSGQPYKGVLFFLSAFIVGVILCYLIR